MTADPFKRPGTGGFFRLQRRFLFAAFVLLAASVAAAATRTAGTVAGGTRFATPYYVQDSGIDGPAVVITGGVHGNEPAGAYAADQIRHWPITRGRIVVLPRANPPALKANKRYTPEVDESLRNLNRNFPKAEKPTPPGGTPADEIWRLVQQHKPTWLIDLHEGYDFHQINPKSVGSSIVVYPTPEAEQAAPLMLAVVNDTIAEEQKKLVRLGPPTDGSLARAAGEHLGCHAMILETTSKDQPISQRARQHRLMVHRLLGHLQMIGPQVTVDWITDREDTSGRVRVAMYDAGGTGGKGPPWLVRKLTDWDGTTGVRVGPEDIRGGVLEHVDVVIFPGGSGSRQAEALGESGRRQVRQFVENGGGYVGICAGAFLAADGFQWGLKILDAKTVSPKWRRGKGMVEIELTDKGREIFGDRSGRFSIKYYNGPILMPAGSDRLPDYVPLAFFRTELAEHGSPEGVMVDSPAIVAGRCAQGRVLCFSPHPEQTEDLEGFVRRAVQWVAERN